MNIYQEHRRKAKSYLRPYVHGETLPDHVNISQADKDKGCPRIGDWIACNPSDPNDRWLVSAEYYAENLELVEGGSQIVAD